MTRFSMFSDKELDVMEEAFCIAGLLRLDEEIRKEKNNRIREDAIKTLKALNQEPILDKIRNEIEELADRLCCDSLYGDGLRHAIDIIDKYEPERGGIMNADNN